MSNEISVSGYTMIYDFPPTPMIMVLGIHFTEQFDIVVPDHLTTNPSVPIFPYRDVFSNWCSRMVVPPAGSDCGPTGSLAILGSRTWPPVGPHMQLDLPAETLKTSTG